MSEEFNTSPAKSSQSPIFVHSELDDAGLDPVQFRVLAHIARRAGQSGCTASLDSMARTVGLHPRTIRATLRFLTERRMISEQRREGHTVVRKITPASTWHPCTLNAPLHSDCPPVSKQQEGTALPVEGTPALSAPPKVLPLKVIPSKVLQEAPLALQFPLHLQSEPFRKAWAEWETYYPTTRKNKAPKRGLTLTLQKQLDHDLGKLTEPEAIASINNSIARGWQGLFPPKASGPSFGRQLAKADHHNKPENVF